MMCENRKNTKQQGVQHTLPGEIGSVVYYVYDTDFGDGEMTYVIDKGKVLCFSLDKAGWWFRARYESGLTYWHQLEDLDDDVFIGADAKEKAEKKLVEVNTDKN